MDEKFEIELKKHLLKCELLYRAKEKPRGSYCDWLVHHCSSVDDIVGMFRWLGFRIKETVECDGAEWVETTSGVIVYVNSGNVLGLVAGRENESWT